MLHILLFFFSSRRHLFHDAIFFGSSNIHILDTGCAKILKKIPAGNTFLASYKTRNFNYINVKPLQLTHMVYW